MTSGAWKGIAVICLVVCIVALFVAFERYQHNAEQVRTIEDISDMTPFGGMIDISPGIPTVTKYALFFAVLSGVGAVASWMMALRTPPIAPPQQSQPPVQE